MKHKYKLGAKIWWKGYNTVWQKGFITRVGNKLHHKDNIPLNYLPTCLYGVRLGVDIDNLTSTRKRGELDMIKVRSEP